jgi:predicted ester cyclase
MKRLLSSVLLLMLMVFISCNNEKAADTTTATTGSNGESKQKEMLEANRKVQRAMETGDSATIRRYISADAIDHGGGPNGTDLKGEDVIRMLSTVGQHIDNLKFEVIQEAANDDHVFCLVRMTGTTNKEVWGMPKGHKMDSKSVDVIRVKDGKMVEHWAYFDMAEMSKMMGGGQASGTGAGAGGGK